MSVSGDAAGCGFYTFCPGPRALVLRGKDGEGGGAARESRLLGHHAGPVLEAAGGQQQHGEEKVSGGESRAPLSPNRPTEIEQEHAAAAAPQQQQQYTQK